MIVFKKQFYDMLSLEHFDWVKADWTGRTAVVTGGINPGTEYELREVRKRWFSPDKITTLWVHEDRLKIVPDESRKIFTDKDRDDMTGSE